MTVEEWNGLKVGDVLIDHKQRDAIRTIVEITRHSGKPTQRGLTRTVLSTTNLKSKDATAYTLIFESENTGPKRFDFAPRP